MTRHRRRIPASNGFTLVEILVVMVLTGFIVTVLLQGLQQVMRLQTHFGAEIFSSQRGAMLTDWYRQSIAGLTPDYIDGKNRFRGESAQMHGQTLQPVTADSGAPTPFAWRIQFDAQSGTTQVRYGDDDAAPVILSWQGSTGRFIYIAADDSTHDVWPPVFGIWPQIPKAIYLEHGKSSAIELIVASPKGPLQPLMRRLDLEKF